MLSGWTCMPACKLQALSSKGTAACDILGLTCAARAGLRQPWAGHAQISRHLQAAHPPVRPCQQSATTHACQLLQFGHELHTGYPCWPADYSAVFTAHSRFAAGGSSQQSSRRIQKSRMLRRTAKMRLSLSRTWRSGTSCPSCWTWPSAWTTHTGCVASCTESAPCYCLRCSCCCPFACKQSKTDSSALPACCLSCPPGSQH